MSSTATTISIKWESKRKFEPREIEFHNLQYKLELTSGIPDIRIFDATQWDSFELGNKQFLLSACRNLVICRPEDAGLWLYFLSDIDEICIESEVDNLLTHYIARVFLRNEERKTLIEHSRIDALTGLYNKIEMQRQLELEFESFSEENPLSILIIDMDNFKRINDQQSHETGDVVLRGVGSLIRSALSNSLKAYRTGGEEFIILIRMNLTQAMALGEFIRKEIEDYKFEGNNGIFSTTVSIGVYTLKSNLSREDCTRKADKALFQAKALGKNRIVNYNDYAEELLQEGIDPEIKNFENRIRVLTERLTNALTFKSKQVMSQIKTEADHDGLTGLYIRRYFDNRLTREFETAKNKNRDLSLIFIDIDHFGEVNKTYGFPTGDQALRVVTREIAESVRNVDWVARYGGEEICVVLPDTKEEAAFEIAKRIWTRIGAQILKAFDGRDFHISASLGVAELTDEDNDMTSFIQRTSDRTRSAKENGRNQICLIDRGIKVAK